MSFMRPRFFRRDKTASWHVLHASTQSNHIRCAARENSLPRAFYFTFRLPKREITGFPTSIVQLNRGDRAHDITSSIILGQLVASPLSSLLMMSPRQLFRILPIAVCAVPFRNRGTEPRQIQNITKNRRGVRVMHFWLHVTRPG